jgi:hypothetical protein
MSRTRRISDDRSNLELTAMWLRRRAFTLIAGAVLLAYFLWTVSSSSDPFSFAEQDRGYYNLLVNGFLAGHLHLLLKPAPQLVHLSNPYDPVANAPYAVHDLSLYHGQYYLYWGPVPALLLFLPFRLFFMGEMPDSLAVALFAFAGACFGIALFRYLVRRYLIATPRWMLALGTVAIVTGSALPFMLRRTAVYEVAISAAYCMVWAGLYLLATSGLERPYRLRRLALGSLCLGLAVGCRPTMIVPALLPLGLLVWIIVREPLARREVLWISVALAGPLAVCGVLLAAYNVLRFGSITEFGQHYQLAGFDVRTKVFGSLSYIPPGAWYYLLAPAHVTAAFPYFHLPPPPMSYPGRLPTGYDGMEATGGLVSNVPISALALFSWVVFRRREQRGLRWVSTVLVVVGLLLVALISYSLWGATMRYEVDFATFLLIPSILVWFALSQVRSVVARWSMKFAGSVVLVWGIAFGVAVGMTGYYNSLLTNQPATYRFLEKLSSPIGVVIARLEGNNAQFVRVDPLERVLATPAAPSLSDMSVQLSSNNTNLYVVAPDAGDYRLVATPVGGGSRPTTTNLCANGGFESSDRGWVGYSGEERLTRDTAEHAFGSAALRISIPDANVQGTVYSTSNGQGIPGRTPVTTSGWMKGTRGATLEFQVRIVNEDGTSSGSITSFTANGRWQRESATASVTPGETGDVVQIIAVRRVASGPDTFFLDGARATLRRSLGTVHVTSPGAHRERVVPLSALGSGLDIHLELGLNRIALRTRAQAVTLSGMTLTRAPSKTS